MAQQQRDWAAASAVCRTRRCGGWAQTLLLLAVVCSTACTAQEARRLAYMFDKKYGQVEVGGPFAGAEFHKSRPLPARISLYYPAANSIDLSTDYWKRDASRPLAIAVQVGRSAKQWIGRDGWRYEVSPQTAVFTNEDSILSYRLSYHFCFTEPAMAVTFVLTNRSRSPQHISVYTHLLMALRTCQTYLRKDTAVTTIRPQAQAVIARFTDADTRNASVFAMNAGEAASRIWCDADLLALTDDGGSRWSGQEPTPDQTEPFAQQRRRAAAAFEYVKVLKPGESLTVSQVIGSATDAEVEDKLTTLAAQWKQDSGLYDDYIRSAYIGASLFTTGDRRLDHSLDWARALLAANAHYLNGVVVPMPCPAEYNFFFTHDLLMTDLGAVNFDCGRVKTNLLYVASLAKDSVIPHAYYWRDTSFTTELCTPSNWNHLWFIELSAAYLRHTLDTTTVRHLYPLIVKSLTDVMTQVQADNLMHAFRPDWWDLGWKEGSRAYITTLGIRAIDDYLFIASLLDPENSRLAALERRGIAMRSALATSLWDDSLHYLINYNGAERDNHFYMGSLLAPAFGLLDRTRSEALIHTAERELLAPGVGMRAVMPADFAVDSVVAYYKISGDEAGQAYTYINGGVWPHNNAWYALALHDVGRSTEALGFVRNMMTVEGAATSPNGVPAMYEYRYSNTSSPRYGEIDKPSFLWAGGFYLYTMYTLAGMTDNPWNLSLADHRAAFDSTVRFTYAFGTPKTVSVTGKGSHPTALTADGTVVASLVLPLELRDAHTLAASFDTLSVPYLRSANMIVHSARLQRKQTEIECRVSSFIGHGAVIEFVSKRKPRSVTVNWRPMTSVETATTADGNMLTTLSFTAGPTIDTVTITW